MHSINLDLLRAASCPADPYAHHRAEHLANLRAVRRQRWQDRLTRLRALFTHRPTLAAQTKHAP